MPTEYWKQNLYAIFVAELVSIAAFSFVAPFLPLYIMELGSYTMEEAALWTGIVMGSGGMAMFISAPIWGVVADRWGRKAMVLRAQFCGTALLLLMALAPNIYILIILRVLQGILTGTVTAANALVSSQTPRNRLHFAMGLIMAAVFSGTTVGPFLGGICADLLGYRASFAISAALLLGSGLLVLFVVREDFTRSGEAGLFASLGGMLRLATSRKMFTLLAVMCVIFACPQIISPVIPLRISEMATGEMAATQSGLALGIMGLLSAVSSFAAGRLAGRFPLKTILVFSCFATGILCFLPMLARTAGLFVCLTGLIGLFIGGLQTPVSTLVGLSAPRDQQGSAYGLSGSAHSLGMGMGALLGGSLASVIGLQPVFAVSGGLFIIAGLLVIRLVETPQYTPKPKDGGTP